VTRNHGDKGLGFVLRGLSGTLTSGTNGATVGCGEDGLLLGDCQSIGLQSRRLSGFVRLFGVTFRAGENRGFGYDRAVVSFWNFYAKGLHIGRSGSSTANDGGDERCTGGSD
jgi:hypothetical protein